MVFGRSGGSGDLGLDFDLDWNSDFDWKGED